MELNDSENSPRSQETRELNFAPIFWLGMVLFYASIALWSKPESKAYIQNNFVTLILLLVPILGLVFYFAYYWIKRDAIKANPTRQAGIVILGIVPVVTLFTVGMLFVGWDYWVGVFRFLLLLIFTLIPPGMYYLFMVSRKSSLLQEYLSNLFRLGLLDARPLRSGNDHARTEDELHRRIRVSSYIKRFEAIYGPIPHELTSLILDSTDGEKSVTNPQAFMDRFQQFSNGAGRRRTQLGNIFTIETLVPVLIATSLIAIGWLMVLPPWHLETNGVMVNRLSQVLITNDTPALYSFLGAYFFSVQMLYRRYIRNDLRVSAYVSVSLRIILAVIGTWVATVSLGLLSADPIAPSILLLLGFTIGVFPPIAWQLIRSGLSKVPFLSRPLVPSMQSNMPVGDLDGLTIWHESRLEEEDIENVPNMATADLVELFLNTKLPPERIIDWVDQAILYTLIGKESDDDKSDHADTKARLQRYGVRSASTLVAAHEHAGKQLEEFENILGDDVHSRIRSYVSILKSNTTVDLIQNWRRSDALFQKAV